MEIYKPNVSKALRAGAVAAALITGAAQAADAPRGFLMTVYSNSAGADSVMKGEYADAIEKIKLDRDLFGQAPSAVSTNLCVAQVMAKQIETARRTCDAAVKEARLEKASTPSWKNGGRKAQNDYIALAYANRAVMHWLAKDAEKAATDLATAERLAPKEDFVSKNLAAMRSSSSTLAAVSVAQ